MEAFRCKTCQKYFSTKYTLKQHALKFVDHEIEINEGIYN